MPDLLLELFSEEIPSRMQSRAAADIKKLVTDALMERGLTYEGAAAFATPRRLALHIAGLPARQPDTREERRGPRVGAPEAAIQGFLKSAGLASIDQAKIDKDPKGKGEFYIAVIAREGKPTIEVLADILPAIIRRFPWPKSMRWGAASTRSDALRWVRPLHSILATFGPETEEPDIVAFDVDGLKAGNVTRGHRFMAPGEITVRRFDDYVPALAKAKVVLDPARRGDIIRHDARDLAFAQGLDLVEDDELLEEVAGLVEWPVALMGEFDAAFLEIPPEVIRATIRANQKCFVLRAPDGALANKFILVSNIVASDGGKAIAAGNERVVRARLSDALYFWRTDLKPLPDYADKSDRPLDQRLAKLRALNIVFHEKLGTQGERVDRIRTLAREIAPLVGADPAHADRAAELCKADLMTEVVGEFPETQGLMGRRYAALQGENADVCTAIEDHYKPQGPGDSAPTNPVSIAVALADKLDTLVGFWAIDEKPTGSKDPYALRRAALGVIRIVLENGLRVAFKSQCLEAYDLVSGQTAQKNAPKTRGERTLQSLIPSQVVTSDLLAFFIDRLKVYLRDKGARHDLIDAAIGAGTLPFEGRVDEGGGVGVGRTLPHGAESVVMKDRATPTPGPSPQGGGEKSAPDDLLMITRRVEALAKFLETDDGKNLLAGYKRAINILRAEEKKEPDGGKSFAEKHAPNLRAQPEENKLALEIERAAKHAHQRVADEDFEGALRALAQLRAPVDAFFTEVTVNDPDPRLRLNRLRILNELRVAMNEVADFSKIAG